MIPKDNGTVAPPRPWIARATIINGRVVASAAIRLPADTPISTRTSTRFFPNMSPNRPATGVAIEVASRNTVNTQVTPVVDVPRSCWSVESAGTTSDCSNA